MAPFPCCTGKILARRRSAAPKQGSPYRPRGAKQGWPRKKSAPPKNYYLGDLYTTEFKSQSQKNAGREPAGRCKAISKNPGAASTK